MSIQGGGNAWPYKRKSRRKFSKSPSMKSLESSVKKRYEAVDHTKTEDQEVIQMFNVRELKALAKIVKLTNYSGLKRDDLANFIMSYWADGWTDGKEFEEFRRGVRGEK